MVGKIENKEIKMKRILVLTIMFLYGGTASAQMADALGSLMIDGELSTEGYQAIGKGQNAMQRVRFQQDLAQLISEIQTTYFGNYAQLSKDGLMFDGFKGVTWDVAPSDDGGFYVELNNMDYASCFSSKGNGIGARRVELNGGGDCQSGATNQIKLFF